MSDPFELFWSTYPRRIAKGAARLAFARALRKASFEDIMAGVSRYVEYIEARGTEMQFVCHASTFLNQERWEDEYPSLTPPESAFDKRLKAEIAARKAGNA